jgi:hypothetical protein
MGAGLVMASPVLLHGLKGDRKVFIRDPQSIATTASITSHNMLISSMRPLAFRPAMTLHLDNRLTSHRRYNHCIVQARTMIGLVLGLCNHWRKGRKA